MGESHRLSEARFEEEGEEKRRLSVQPFLSLPSI